MRTRYLILTLFLLLIGATSCDKDFVEINTNPTAISSLDPAYMLAHAEYNGTPNGLTYEGAIVQHIVTPYGGVLEGGNRNTYIDSNADDVFGLYTGAVKNITDAIRLTENDPLRSNVYNMARIWKAYLFMRLVDTYGDVPYTEAGLGYVENTFLPKYDDQKLIYADILKELKEASAALDPTKDQVKNEIFYGGNIASFKKLGYSLLLRAGMRYTKYDQAVARQAAQDALAGGVFTSNADNAFIQHTSEGNYTYGLGNTLNGGERANYYLGAPFISHLKATNDPRISQIAVLYPDPVKPVATAGTPNTNPADQIGMPFGYDENGVMSAPGYPGKIGSAFKYSQANRATVASVIGRQYIITNAQVQLLLAEAHVRGYITAGTPQGYYEAAIRSHMTQGPIDVTVAEQDAYLAQPQVAFDPAIALEQINNQYWVASFMIWGEAWANFRRSGYPELDPINYPGEDPSVETAQAGGFIHKLPYSNRERSVNPANLEEAVARMGSDNLGTRVFWDVQ